MNSRSLRNTPSGSWQNKYVKQFSFVDLYHEAW
jgi:hypothetical protein